MVFTDKDFENAYPKLKHYALYLTNNKHNEAEDLLHDTILKILEKQDTYDEKYTVDKWGASIMHNLIIDRRRRLERFKNPLYLEDIITPHNSLKINMKSDMNDSINRDFIVRNKCRKIKNALRNEIKTKKYRDEEKTEMNLQYFIFRCVGLSLEEISNHTGIRVNTVKGRIHDMKQQILETVSLD
jgi:RNA polymerase sigma factor (sigma-70 family)